MCVEPTELMDMKSKLTRYRFYKKYSDLFITVKLTSTASIRRTVNTISMAVANIYSQILLHRRLLCPHCPLVSLDRQAIRNIVEICRKQYTCDKRLLQRLNLPLMAAAINTDHSAESQWLLARLYEMKDLHIEGAWAYEVAQRVLSEQQTRGPGSWIDLGDLLREYTR